MTPDVVTVRPDTPVREIARILVDNRIGAVPVVDGDGSLVGIVSEADLMRRVESHTERRPSRWAALLLTPDEQLEAYRKTQGRRAQDVMTAQVVSADEDTDVRSIATLLEEHGVKHVPIVRGSELVGIVSRANLLHGLATATIASKATADDASIRTGVLETLRSLPGMHAGTINVTVSEGVVHIWGLAESEAAKAAATVAAENTPGVRGIENHLSVLPPMIRSMV